jgi:hypothetical protein
MDESNENPGQGNNRSTIVNVRNVIDNSRNARRQGKFDVNITGMPDSWQNPAADSGNKANIHASKAQEKAAKSQAGEANAAKKAEETRAEAVRKENEIRQKELWAEIEAARARTKESDVEKKAESEKIKEEKEREKVDKEDQKTSRLKKNLINAKKFSYRRVLVSLMIIGLGLIGFSLLASDNIIKKGAGIIFITFFAIEITRMIIILLNKVPGLKKGIKFVAGLVIVIIFIFFTVMTVYGQTAPKCAHLREEGVMGWDAYRSDLKNPDFWGCMVKEVGIPIKGVLEQISITKHVLNFLDQQIYRATGDYYFYEIDKNSKEPVGVFIKNINIEPFYYYEDAIAIDAEIEVKTIGTIIKGIFSCDIGGVIFNSLTNNGRIEVEKTISFPAGCFFNAYKFTPSTKQATYSVQFDFQTFAAMAPVFIRRDSYNAMTPEQKSSIVRKADGTSLKTTNAPVKIGGGVGGDNKNLVLLSETSENEIKLGITLHADNFDEGNVKRINELIISIPKDLKLKAEPKSQELQPRTQTNDEETKEKNTDSAPPATPTPDASKKIQACGGYTFELVSDCSKINSDFSYNQKQTDSKTTPPSANDPKKEKQTSNEEDFKICNTENSNTYRLIQDETSKKIEQFEKFKTITCWLRISPSETKTSSDSTPGTILKSQFENFFTEDEVKVGTRVIPIKIATHYRFEISKKRTINIRSKSSGFEYLRTSDCSSFKQEELSSLRTKAAKIDGKAVDFYAKKLQSSVISTINKNLPKGYTSVQIEAIVAAVMYKFSGLYLKGIDAESTPEDINTYDNNKNKNSEIDFVTGCTYNVPTYENFVDDNLKDISCFIEEIKRRLEIKGATITDVLSGYYTQRNADYKRQLESLNGEDIKQENYRKILYEDKSRASEEDVHAWLGLLCKETADEKKAKETELKNNLNTEKINDPEKIATSPTPPATP